MALVVVTALAAVLGRLVAGRVLRPIRAISSTARRTDGLGLGLSIVRAVVLAHRGQLAVTARPGGGLDITVELPELPA